MNGDTPPGKPVLRSHTLRHAVSRLRATAPPARRRDDRRTRRTAASAVEELLGRYHARPLPYEQMKRTERLAHRARVATARNPIAAEPMLGNVLVGELTPYSLEGEHINNPREESVHHTWDTANPTAQPVSVPLDEPRGRAPRGLAR